MSAYELRAVARWFSSGERRVAAVDGVDLAVGRGEHVSITGPSGSGKTTLLQLLGALDRPSAGAVRFEGDDLASLDDRALTRVRARRIGFVFQQFNLIPTLSARVNVEAAALGLPRRERRSRALAGLASVGLADRAGHLPSQLSGGEQQRVAVARALVNDPEVLLADEPTGNLDRASSDTVADLLASVAGKRTVIVVTHDATLAARAPRVVRLEDGRVVADGPPARVAAVDHVEVAVPDVGEASRWYREVLGSEPGLRTGDAPPRAWLAVDDVAEARRRLQEAGVAVDEEGRFSDPWGNPLGLA